MSGEALTPVQVATERGLRLRARIDTLVEEVNTLLVVGSDAVTIARHIPQKYRQAVAERFEAAGWKVEYFAGSLNYDYDYFRLEPAQREGGPYR